MKIKTLTAIILILSAILSLSGVAYAGEARAYANITIIIPPREDKADQKESAEVIQRIEDNSREQVSSAK